MRIAKFANLRFTKAAKTPSSEDAAQLLDLLRVTFHSTFRHEQFHHKVESFGFRLLVMTGTNLYGTYKNAVYRPTFKTSECLEESLANAESYLLFHDGRYIRRVDRKLRAAARSYLPYSFKFQPPGYKEGGEYLTAENFSQGFRKLRSQMRDGRLTVTTPESNWLLATDIFRSLMAIDQRIFMVPQPGSPGLFNRTG